jgi:cellulose synthase/poly-beta-1,6-N-acetylglucosamine synthase-like glycosyltransferase
MLLVPVIVLFAEVVLGVTAGTHKVPPNSGRRKLAVVIPAHDEALVIASAIRSILPQLSDADRLIVVADNCTDQTAAIAAIEGAEVIVRHDLTRRGKGYALDFGVRHLETHPPDILLVIDADCQPADGAIDRLSRVCAGSARPVQALYLMRAVKNAGLSMRIAEFAWIVKNQIRPTGLHRLGLPCQLMGTGMAFPWACISSAELATGHIVEDLKLGIDLARAGVPPLFCPQALVTSSFPETREGTQSQRIRWEHGHLSVILSQAPRLLLDSFARLSADSMALALDLIVPPLALLVLLVAGVWFAAVLLFVFTKSSFSLVVMTGAVLSLMFSVVVSWLCYGRHIISLSDLGFAVIHVISKIPLYIRFVVARQLKWVRSKRESNLP